jgi:hypothetical protein
MIDRATARQSPGATFPLPTHRSTGLLRTVGLPPATPREFVRRETHRPARRREPNWHMAGSAKFTVENASVTAINASCTRRRCTVEYDSPHYIAIFRKNVQKWTSLRTVGQAVLNSLSRYGGRPRSRTRPLRFAVCVAWSATAPPTNPSRLGVPKVRRLRTQVGMGGEIGLGLTATSTKARLVPTRYCRRWRGSSLAADDGPWSALFWLRRTRAHDHRPANRRHRHALFGSASLTAW